MKQVRTIDKFLHTWISALIVLVVGSFLFYICKEKPVYSAFVGWAVALAIGILKEFLWDKFLKKGTFSVADLAADFIGSATGLVGGLILFCNTINI